MSAPHADQIIGGYLARLEQALSQLPPARRAELVDDVRSHIAEARRGLADETDADLLNILDKLGDPADIATDARDRLGVQTAPPAMSVGVFEIAAIVALVFVWPAGIALVWLSSAWSQRDKLIATVLVPGGVVALAILLAVSGLGYFRHFYILFLGALLTPVVWSVVAIYLAVRLYQERRSAQTKLDAGGSSSSFLEIAAVVLTPLVWPIGVILLWTSTAWNARDKLIGTILPPGGYFGVAVILMILRTVSGGSCTASSDSFGTVSSSCTTYGPPHWVLLAMMLTLLVLPLCSAAYLAVRLRGARLFKPALAS